MATRNPLEQLADEIIAAAESADVGRLQKIFSPDFVFWQNTSMVAMPRAAAFQAFELLVRIPKLQYQDIRRHYWEDGFVSQHVVTGQKRDGSTFRLPTCYVAEVRDGQVTRIEEWLDSAAAASLIEAIHEVIAATPRGPA